MNNLLKRGFTAFALLAAAPSFAGAPNYVELSDKYPDIAEGSAKPVNTKILCPFHRLLERAGLYDSSKKTEDGTIMVTVAKITTAAKNFGCQAFGCASITSAVSGAQITEGVSTFAMVNLMGLHKALGFSHQCGLSFDKDATEISADHIAATLDDMRAHADEEGHLTLDDIRAVKLDICASQGTQTNFVQDTELKLMYSFLGGNDRGYVDYEDVARFLNAELPKTIGTINPF